MELTEESFVAKLRTLQSAAELKKYERFFPLAKRNGDQFIGVRMGQVFKLAKEFMGMPLKEVEKLLENPVHEVRVGAVSIMDFQARSKKTSEGRKKELFDLYLRRHDRINTWDLVDRSAFHVVGSYLADKPRAVLYKLARSNQMAERRTAMVSTAMFEDTADTFKIARMLLGDQDELIHKAAGWMLRVAGDKDRERLLAFLDEHAATMPRAMLRYAIEKLEAKKRAHYLAIKQGN